MTRLLPIIPLASMVIPRSQFTSQFQIDRHYEPFCQLHHHSDGEESPPLHRILCDLDPALFPSLSQARRAIQHGRLLVLSAGDLHSNNDAITSGDGFDEKLLDHGRVVVNPTTAIRDRDVVAVRSRVPNGFYPQSCTKYVDPPPNFADITADDRNAIAFEDDHIAVVNKPEGTDTIGEGRSDLQSALPFLMRPPAIRRTKRRIVPRHYLPRPIHRLDRGTSGCVLVAKSERAMAQFSRAFATRRIRKSYHAIVFGEPEVAKDGQCKEVGGKTFSVIDYPIDGKAAVTLWRTVATTTTSAWGKLSMLHLLPQTGRNHQLRRHLAYCLSCPIMGDPKYDGGGSMRRAARAERGMFLCSDSVTFRHALSEEEEEGTVVVASVALPDKFHEVLGFNEGDLLA